MDIFDLLSLIGGLCLFLFGMNVMGQALERRAGGTLRTLLGKLTTSKMKGFFTGLVVTGIIQSSSATTVMVVGFVNSGLMNLKQAINVIMGANVGTTVTAWLLSLSGIESGNIFVQLLKPTSFTPVLALIGIIFYMFLNDSKKKDTGMILLGFATLMFGMDTMSAAVSGLSEVESFKNMFIMFKNPILGVVVGTILTAIIQSSSASVGILQALAVTGQVSYGAAIPIIMGQNIGTCVTAMLSCVGANKNAKRAAIVHLAFNIIGTAVGLIIFCIIKAIFSPVFLDAPASLVGIAVAHSAFNVLCTAVLLPMSGVLEKVANRVVRDDKKKDEEVELDERLLATPPLALESCHVVASEMAELSVSALKDSMNALEKYTPELNKLVKEKEDKSDHYEDILGTYLVKLSSSQISEADSTEAAKLLKMIGDFERISDHAVNVIESAEELHSKELEFTESAMRELSILTGAVNEIMDLALKAFLDNDLKAAETVEPLEEVIDGLKEQMRTRHILRLQQRECSIDAGFVWSDLLTNLERCADHCSNIAGCILETADMNIHESMRDTKRYNQNFKDEFERYAVKYALSK
ncbi:MAG: Na/Pi cotransporter family protein [Anaerovoracaceae bacterium]|nr:Na/Pi cotransporter family protein [Anaerovoracaceae bacterium]